MESPESSTVEVETAGGRRIVLRPVIPLERLPGLSRGGLAAALVLSAVFLATSVYRLNHTDLWGHLSFGRWICEHAQLPMADPFRWDLGDQPFLNVPWLSQVLGYLWHEALGLEGLVLGHAVLVTVCAVAMMMATKARGVSTGWAVAAAAVSYLLALPVVGTIRPQLFGTVAFAAVLLAMARLPERRHPLAWLPAVFALWANLHGSFVIGLGALGCFALGRTWEAVRTGVAPRHAWGNPTFRRAWLAVALAVAATCVNPLGPRLLPAVLGFATGSNLEGISEWRAMTLTSLSGGVFFSSLAVTGLLLRFSPRRITLTEALLVVVFGLAAMMAIRMLAWWALVWPWVITPHAAAAWRAAFRVRSVAGASPPSDEDLTARFKRLLVAAGAVLLVVWWSPPTHALLTARPRPAEAILSTDTPHDLAEAIVAQRLEGRIVAPMDWADYLIWRTEGEVKPLVYSHVHLTGPDLWRDYLRLRGGSPGWRQVSERHEIRYFVLSRARNRRLRSLAQSEPQCEVLYRGEKGLIVRVGP